MGDAAPTSPDAVAAPASLRSRTIRASLWAVVEIGGSRVLRLAGNMILTRLLFPEVFGLMTLVQAFAMSLLMLSDIGLGPCVVQNPRGGETRFLNTVWSLQIVRGVFIWTALAALSPLLAMAWEEPQLQWLLPVIGLSAAINGFDSTDRYTLNKKLHLGRLTMFDLVAQAVALVVMITWAVISPSVWALVAGNVTNALVRMVLSYRLVPGTSNAWCWDRQVIGEVLRFGKWILLTSGIGVLATQVDKLTFAAVFEDRAMLGFFGIAFMLASLPDNLVSTLGYKVIFPAASEKADLPRPELRALILKSRFPLLLALSVPLALLACFSDILVGVLYTPEYAQVGWMLSLLAIGLWPRMLANTIGVALLAIGQSKYLAFSSALRFLYLLIGILLAQDYGPYVVLVVIAAASLMDYLPELIGQARHGLLALKQDLVVTLCWLALMAALLFARHQFGMPLPFAPQVAA